MSVQVQDFTLISLNRDCVESANCEAVFYPPKLVFIEGKRFLRVINVENIQEPEIILNIECGITDYFLQQQFLWFILETGNLLVYDLYENLHLKMEIDKTIAYKAIKFKSDGLNLFITNESEELFHAPYSVKELQVKLREGNQITNMTLLKSRTSRRQLYPNGVKTCKKNMDVIGLNLLVKQGTLVAECPLTGMSAVSAPSSQTVLEDIAQWDNIVVIKGAECIWLVEIMDGQEILNIRSDHYVKLLDQYKNRFYYIILDNTSVQVKYIEKVSNCLEDVSGTTNHTSRELRESQMQVLFKQELQKLVTSIITTKNYDNNAYNEIYSYFVKIDDFNFLLDLSISLCRNNFAYKTCLLFLRSKLENIDDKNAEMKLQHAIIKVEIYEYIKRNDKSKYFEIDVFEYSYQNLCIMFISSCDLDLATMTWLKWFRTQPILTCEDIEDLLQCVPSNIKINMLMVWLKVFIPSLIDISPFYIDLFIKWTTERVFAMESSIYWPKISIKFIEEVISVLKDSYSEILVSPPAIDGLDVLRVHLANIKELKEKYKINILVGELSSQSPAEVVLIMLHRCYTEDLQSLLSVYLPRYASRHSLELDNILRTHIEAEAARGGGSADDVRLEVFLKAFRSRTLKYECLLHVLKVLDVPWSTAVQKMAIEAAKAYSDDFTLTEIERVLSRQIEIELNYAYYRIILKKYNFSAYCTDYILVLHKIVNSSSVDLNDLKIVMRVMRGFCGYGSILYIDRCLRDCKTKEALDYYNELPMRDQKTLIKSMIKKLEFMFKDTMDLSILELNYIDFLKGTTALNVTEISDIQHLYHLKNSHKICLAINDVYHEKRCKNIFYEQNCVPNTQIEACISNIRSMYCPGMANDMEMMKYLSLCSNKKVRSLIKEIITEYFMNKENQMSFLRYFKGNQNTELLLECCKIFVQMIVKCAEEYIHNFLNIFSVLNTLMNSNLIIKNVMVIWKYNYIYIPISSISSTDDLIHFYENNAQNEIEVSLSTIFNMTSDFVYLRILSGINYNYSKQSSDNDLCTFIEARRKIVKKIVSKILAYQEYDEILLMSLLLIIDADNMDNESCKTNSDLASVLGMQGETMSSALATYLCKPSVLYAFGISDTISKSRIFSPYSMIKTKCNIDISDLPLSDFEETWDVRRILFYVLNSNSDICFGSLVDLCQILNITIDDGLFLQIITILTTWKLKYKVYFDDLNRKKIIFFNDERSLYSRCLPLWESITNKKNVTDVLKELWKNGEYSLYGQLVSINPYYYEVYITIYNLLCNVLSEWQTIKESYLLYFLQQYRRTGSPKQYEFEFFSIKGIFPEIGQYRLPFQLFMQDDMWTNLKSEITLETYEQWLPAAKLLALDADEQTARDILCSNALKQTMTERKQTIEAEANNVGCELWKLEAREEPLLRAAHHCVRHVANMEWAGACLFYVLQGCARGADQVAAAQLCYHFAQHWAAMHPFNRAVQKMQRIYSSLSTRHALHKVEWACDELLRLVAEPAQLVRTLYLHPGFIEKMAFYDINSTADEIAEKNGINISSIRIQLLENILEQNENSKTKKNTSGLDMTELMRAKYILRATCPKMGAIYLARIALDEETDLNKSKKMRALQCLISIVDPDTVIKVTNKERESLWQSLLELYYATKLESTGMPWAGAALVSDRTRVLEQLVTTATTDLEQLRLCAQLTRRYGNAALVRKLLPLLTRASLLDDLACLLLKYNVADKDSREAWRTVLIGPFQRADYPITDKQRSYCLKAINMLMLYEDITDEDLKVIWGNCIRCKCYALGCLILPYMSVQSRKTLIELQKFDKRNIIAGIKNLHSETCLVNSAMFIVESLLFKKRY